MSSLGFRYAAVALVAVGLSLPASASANPSADRAGQIAATHCVAEKRVLGKRSFAKDHGVRWDRGTGRAGANRRGKAAAKPRGKRLVRLSMRRCLRKARVRAQAAINFATAECMRDLSRYGSVEFAHAWGSFQTCVGFLSELAFEGGWDEEPYRPY